VNVRISAGTEIACITKRSVKYKKNIYTSVVMVVDWLTLTLNITYVT